jgi:hypothetical protein
MAGRPFLVRRSRSHATAMAPAFGVFVDGFVAEAG